jgi:hypothetical protein
MLTYSVPFADYEADMKETAEQAAGIIRKLRREITNRDQLIIWLIKAAGGEIRVPIERMLETDGTFQVWEDPANFARIYKVEK